MILLRQKIFADRDYAGLNMFQRIMKRADRNRLARQIQRGRERANSVMNDSIKRSNNTAKTELDMLANSDFSRSKRENDLATKDILNRNQQNVNNAVNARNQEYDRLLNRADRKDRRISRRYVKDRTPDYGVKTVTKTYKEAPKPAAPKTSTNVPTTTSAPATQPQQRQGIGFGGKLAIGAGVAAAGYGAYRLIKARRQRQQAEEGEGAENTQQAPQGNQPIN